MSGYLRESGEGNSDEGSEELHPSEGASDEGSTCLPKRVIWCFVKHFLVIITPRLPSSARLNIATMGEACCRANLPIRMRPIYRPNPGLVSICIRIFYAVSAG